MELKRYKVDKEKIHLGCGLNILEGYINVDIVKHTGVDLVWDLSEGIPYEDNSFIEVRAIDFLEHIRQEKVILFMNEVYRVLRPGGIFVIRIPEAPGITAFQDPTHVSFWNEETITYFLAGNVRREQYGVYYGITAKYRRVSFKRKRHQTRNFFKTLNINYLANFFLEIELSAVKED